MKQEELNNLEDEETPEQEEASAALRKKAKSLKSRGKKNKREGIFKGSVKSHSRFYGYWQGSRGAG